MLLLELKQFSSLLLLVLYMTANKINIYDLKTYYLKTTIFGIIDTAQGLLDMHKGVSQVWWVVCYHQGRPFTSLALGLNGCLCSSPGEAATPEQSGCLVVQSAANHETMDKCFLLTDDAVVSTLSVQPLATESSHLA